MHRVRCKVFAGAKLAGFRGNLVGQEKYPRSRTFAAEATTYRQVSVIYFSFSSELKVGLTSRIRYISRLVCIFHILIPH